MGKTMNEHRTNYHPERRVGFGWALCIIAGGLLAAVSLTLRACGVL
jgi:hypothetical protein